MVSPGTAWDPGAARHFESKRFSSQEIIRSRNGVVEEEGGFT